MSGTPKFKIFRDKEYVAACKYAEDAAAMVSNCGAGGTIKYSHRWVVWREGQEEFGAGESYDRAADVMLARIKEWAHP